MPKAIRFSPRDGKWAEYKRGVDLKINISHGGKEDE